jgi:cholinesterase
MLPIIDSMVGCSSGGAVSARRKQGIPSWRYLYMAEFPNQAIYPNIGAYHSIDCPTVFGSIERNTRVGKNTPEQDQFIKNVMMAWASFAKDPEKGLLKLGWPIYDSSGKFGYFKSMHL